MIYSTQTSVVDKALSYVRQLLNNKLTNDHRHHNLAHTLAVRKACLELAQAEGLSEEDQEVLELAALFHDTGMTEVYEGHEAISHRIANEFLTAEGYPKEKMDKVLACIAVTYLPNRPANLLEEIIRDADLIHLGSDRYLMNLEGLRHEWKVLLGQDYDDAAWYKLNYDFLNSQTFFTEAGSTLYGDKLAENVKKVKKLAKAKKKEKKKKKASNGTSIQGNKSAQMMFKTSLRNHIDLSTLADNKANIMLSVNALIITIIVPLAAGPVRDSPYLIWPVLVLLSTCLTSMIFATLATRPIAMVGHTETEAIESGRSNLFFFGNFYKMDYSEYKTGIQSVIQKDEKLDDSITRDLFFLGKSLGKKYAQLRTCYTIFMIGISGTVITFIVTYALNN